MEFYTSIAPYYDLIFPYDPTAAAFTDKHIPRGRPRTLLDVGCATGSLLFALADRFDEIRGIDLDPGLIASAKQRFSDNTLPGISVSLLSMIDIGRAFPAESFTGISCYGNTLVHLNDESEICDFFTSCRGVLWPGGSLLIQIINYDRILDRGIPGLPSVENSRIRFDRAYSPPEPDGRILFTTQLSVRETGEVIENRISLLPLRKENLTALLTKSGFSSIASFGSFDAEPWSEDSYLTIVSAVR